MKHPDLSLEACEFNLGRAPVLRCSSSTEERPSCGQCDSCQIGQHLTKVHSWLQRAGHQSRRRFILGLIRRLHSVDLLQHVISLLRPVMCKDFTYARSRVAPSMEGDRATHSGDRALSGIALETSLANVWIWFESASYWTKSNFLMGVLQRCEPHELHVVGTHAQTLLAPQQRTFIPTDDYEAESIASSTPSFHTENNSELQLLKMKPEYSEITSPPFSPPREPENTEEKEKRPDDEELFDDASSFWGCDDDGIDPTCMVIPVSTKAYSGVAKYVDFICRLPVHLSKYVLSFLDTSALHNCICVNQHWRNLAEEVHKEFFVNQRLWEEVMLMQGAAAQSCNPIYAKDIDVAVPNIRLHSWQAIKTDEDKSPSPAFKSEVSMASAYSGFSTRNIIMEERNVYCGPYNVMVLSDNHDPGRVIHTDGSHLIAFGSTDRKVRFLNSSTAHEEDQTISGHAGSIRCLALDSSRQFVFSGSYDTSIRKWSLETGKCLKIFHGHRDTINCIQIHGDLAVSSAKDNSCKVWNINTMECLRTFKHRDSVTAVRMSDDLCITGCNAGKVKVWDMASGKLIKRLTGHHAGVTGIRFDRWHIITASKDGYALAWSSQGDHARCLTAFRHPKEVLCVEFMYLRVITGAADGKIRIWNMVTGQCLRIMRGNSRSDPITEMIAIENRISINTVKNVLVFNFEPTKFDYALENDKMPPLVQYISYSDTPVRPQPYPYIRAQRMAKAGATNTKIVHHDENKQDDFYHGIRRTEQIAHSAKTLSSKRLEMAKRIQSADARLQMDRTPSRRMMRSAARGAQVRNAKSASAHGAHVQQQMQEKKKPQTAPRSASPHSAVSLPSSQARIGNQEDSSMSGMKRRVSWAFEDPLVPPSKDLSLTETKSLLRSQMRIPEEEQTPPDYIYLKVNAIQNKLKQPAELTRTQDVHRKEEEMFRWRSGARPSSSPSKIDPRTKVMVKDLSPEELRMLHLIPEQPEQETKSEANESLRSMSAGRGRRMPSPAALQHAPQPLAVITEYASEKIEPRTGTSMHANQVKSHIPCPRLLRPHTAGVVQNQPSESAIKPAQRPLTALSGIKVETAPISNKQAAKEKPYSSSANESCQVPMLMYSSDLREKLKSLKERRPKEETAERGRVSEHNHPLRNHVNFKLRTHQQVEHQIQSAEIAHQEALAERERKLGNQQRKLWLARVKEDIKNLKNGIKVK